MRLWGPGRQDQGRAGPGLQEAPEADLSRTLGRTFCRGFTVKSRSWGVSTWRVSPTDTEGVQRGQSQGSGLWKGQLLASPSFWLLSRGVAGTRASGPCCNLMDVTFVHLVIRCTH